MTLSATVRLLCPSGFALAPLVDDPEPRLVHHSRWSRLVDDSAVGAAAHKTNWLVARKPVEIAIRKQQSTTALPLRQALGWRQ